MDPTLRKLLVELARTTLRVLEADAAPVKAGKPEPAPAVVAVPVEHKPVAGTVVRVWTGDRYEAGQIESVCRGEPRRVWVRVSRGDGRRVKRVRVEWAKCQLV